MARLAAHWKITNAKAALLLLEWVEQGLGERVDDLMGPATHGRGCPPHPPGRADIAQLGHDLAAAIGGAASGSSTAEAALAIIEHGSVRAARRTLAQRAQDLGLVDPRLF